MTAEIEKAQKNAEAAVARLEAFMSLPVQNERDQAGITHAFDITFWRRRTMADGRLGAAARRFGMPLSAVDEDEPAIRLSRHWS